MGIRSAPTYKPTPHLLDLEFVAVGYYATWLAQKNASIGAMLGIRKTGASTASLFYNLLEWAAMVDRVSATPATLEAIEYLVTQHGSVMFFQSGGCCENTAPQCFPMGEFHLSPNDIHIGDIGGAPYYMAHREYDFWQNTHLIVDVVKGRSGTFSLDGPNGTTFICRSRLFTDEEVAMLELEKSA